jgi:signal transduction histidine kinase
MRSSEASGGEVRSGVSPPTEEEEASTPPAWLVLGVLAATMVGFAGSMAFSQHLTAKLDENASSIATDASPAIESLTAARGELFQIPLLAASAVLPFGNGGRVDRAPFLEALARLRRHLAEYLALPFYPAEHDRYVKVEQATRDLDHLDAGDGPGAVTILRTGISPDASRVDGAIQVLVAFNAEQQHRMAVEIPRQRVLGNRVGHLLAGVTAVLGVLLMVLVMRAIRQSARLLRGRHRLLAEHARDGAAFGSTLESIVSASVSISRAVAAVGDSNQVFQMIADRARLVVNAQYCAVGCGTDPSRPFEPWVFSGISPATAAALGRAPRPAGLLGAVTQQRHSMRLADVSAHPAFRGLPPQHPAMAAFLGVPILHDDGSNIGNLYLAREPGQPPFTEADERAADLLASYVATAIGNARLYRAALAANRARDDLLATVSHDLKNPLNAIRLATGALQRATGPAKAGELMARIDRAAARMGRLIEDLLDAAKIESGGFAAKPQPVDVVSIVESAVDMLRVIAAEKSIELAPLAPSQPVVVLCERDLILRVFGNLIGNAIKFSPAGSSISVAAEERPGQVHFSVSDAGPGIPAEYLSRVFDRYWQEAGGDRRGSGLGLYIAKGIVEAHGGRIWIDSAPGRGTTIHFILPVVQGRDDAAASLSP